MAYTTINKSTDYFNTKNYTGNGSDAHGITGVGFRPDFVWTKIRSGADNHGLYDVVRGVNKNLQSNSNYAEQSYSTLLQSFDSDGFTIGTNGEINANSGSFVSWNWLAGGSQGSSNTDGSINTTYTSANTTAGFSIIQYNGNGSNGATIGHGLGVAPTFVMIKRTDTTSNWIVATGAKDFGFTRFTYLNDAGSTTTNAGPFNDTAPSSSVITLGTWNDVNNSSGTYICYAFAEKTGFSKFGSYKGNGADGANSNGPFVYTGFRPAFIMIRGQSTTNWNIIDNKSDGFNPDNDQLYANSTSAEATGAVIDILSNGFKIRTTAADLNNNNTPTFYMAFAETPLVGSNNIPSNAR